MVHLRGHDSVTISFDVDDRPVTLLMLVRGSYDTALEPQVRQTVSLGNHHDMSLLYSARSMEISNGAVI